MSDASDPVRAAFDKFDADGSGRLERGELLKVLEELGLDVSDGEFVSYAEALMEDYDADGNGELDFEEFKKLYAQCLASEETRNAYAEELREAVGGLVGGALSAIVENDAAAKIQAVHRGKQAREEVRKLKEETPAAASEAMQAPRPPERTAVDEKQTPPKPTDESEDDAVESVVGELVEEVSASTEPTVDADGDDLEEQEAAALKIQAVHRGKQARKELQEKREMEAAAVKIQAVHRGKQARKELEEKRREAPEPEAPPAESEPREEPSTTDPVRAAFDKFDADGSGRLERGELLKVLEELGLDVSDGEFVSYAEALMEDYDADGNGELDFEEFKKLYAQCLASEETRNAYAEELREAVGGLVGGALSAIVENNAAAKIQAVHRGKQARKELQKLKEGDKSEEVVATADTAPPEETEPAPSKPADESEDDAVESMVEDLIEEVSAAIEPVGGADDDDLKEQAAAALKIQAVHRGKQARKELHEKREMEAAALKIQAMHRGKQTRMELRKEREEQEAAALKIQAMHRGKQTRMELRKEREEQEAAALKIQAMHRGKQTRTELRKEREREAVLKPASSSRRNKVVPLPLSGGKDEEDTRRDASNASDASYSEDENGHARAEDAAVRAASSLVGANPELAGALEAAAAVSNRPSAARSQTSRSRGGLSKHMVNDLAKRLPSLCGGGRGGEMEALKLIAAVVATRRRAPRANKVAPLA